MLVPDRGVGIKRTEQKMRFAGILGAVCLSMMVMAAPTPGVPQDAELTQKEAEDAARSVARFCKILVNRMEEIISDQWATQDLQDLAAVWDSLDCHQVFGIDERVRWLVR